MYVRMYVCMYVRTYVLYICTYVCMYAYTYVCMHVCMYMCDIEHTSFNFGNVDNPTFVIQQFTSAIKITLQQNKYSHYIIQIIHVLKYTHVQPPHNHTYLHTYIHI